MTYDEKLEDVWDQYLLGLIDVERLEEMVRTINEQHPVEYAQWVNEKEGERSK